MKHFITFLLIGTSLISFAQQKFNTLQEVLVVAEKNNYSSLIATQQQHLANLTTTSSYGNAFNPRIPSSISITDNAKLPVTFIPAEAFGGPSGSFKQLTMGQRYVSVLNFSPQFDILNFGSLAKIKSAKLNEELTYHNNLLTKKNLFDQVNACYHNILSFQSQIEILQQNKLKADTLYHIVAYKYNQGLVRKQDLNEAEINQLNITDKIEQAKFSLEQQYLTLKLLCETDENILVIQQLSSQNFENQLQASGNLVEENLKLQYDFARAEYKAALWQNLPTLSFVTSFNWQNNSNTNVWDKQKPWINNNFWSLKLAWDFPTNVPKLTAVKSNLISYNIAAINAKHAALQTKIQNEQLEKDYSKSLSLYQNNLLIYQLKKDNYQKSKNQFDANILALDKLLIAYNDLLLSELNVATSLASIAFNKSKIEINNQVK